MTPVTKLRARDNEILRALTLKVRLFSLEQLAAAWWSPTRSGKDNARKRMSALAELGLVVRVRPLARPLPECLSVLAAWAPGQPQPELSALAWSLQSRWQKPPQATTCFVASKRAASLFGGRGRGELKHDYQATHDLGVSAVYLQFREAAPEREEKWIGEDVLRPHYRKRKLPDAVLASTPSATPELVIEFGGAYDLRRLKAFHKDCQQKHLPYEIW